MFALEMVTILNHAQNKIYCVHIRTKMKNHIRPTYITLLSQNPCACGHEIVTD